MSTFNGKRALVTGAGKGIGRETAILLSSLGAQVVAISRTQADLQSLQKEIECQTITADLSDVESARYAANQAGEIDLLVNNRLATVGRSVVVGIDSREGQYSRGDGVPLRIGRIGMMVPLPSQRFRVVILPPHVPLEEQRLAFLFARDDLNRDDLRVGPRAIDGLQVGSGFGLRGADAIFETLHRRALVRALVIGLFIHVDPTGANPMMTPAAFFRHTWPWRDVPIAVYCDARIGGGGDNDDDDGGGGGAQGVMHAKCVVVDEEAAFVTSASHEDGKQHPRHDRRRGQGSPD